MGSQHRTQYTVNLMTGVLRIQHSAGRTQGLAHPVEVLEIAVAQRVVHQFSPTLRAATWGANNMQNGDIFRIAARQAIHRTEFPDPKGSQQRSGPGDPGITVRRIGSVKLVGTPDPAHMRMVDHMVKKLQIVITRHAKQMPDAAPGNSVEQVIRNGVRGLHDSFPSDGNLMLSIEEASGLSRKRRR